MGILLIILPPLILLGCVAKHTELVGYPVVLDADTLVIGEERIRLKDVDAPERKQSCQYASGTDYLCGISTSEALQAKIGRQQVRCVGSKLGKYGRVLGTCYLGKLNLNQWLVENGLALAYRQFSTAYVHEENRARALRKGIWSGTFTPPWEWRKQH